MRNEDKTKVKQAQDLSPVEPAGEKRADKERREFLKKFSSGVFAMLLMPGIFSKKFSTLADAADVALNPTDVPEVPSPTSDEDPIIRMTRDLKRALAKPVEERKWAMVIDLRKCVGCHACTIGCVAERYCITACPYSARTFDTGRFYTEEATEVAAAYVGREKAKVYEKSPTFDFGEARPRVNDESPIGNVRKCHFCLHRLEKGMLPECVVTCIGRATFHW